MPNMAVELFEEAYSDGPAWIYNHASHQKLFFGMYSHKIELVLSNFGEFYFFQFSTGKIHESNPMKISSGGKYMQVPLGWEAPLQLLQLEKQILGTTSWMLSAENDFSILGSDVGSETELL